MSTNCSYIGGIIIHNWLRNEYIKRNRTANELAKEKGVHIRTVFRWLEKHNLKKTKRNGRTVHNGYVKIRMSEHPNNICGYIYEHRYIMEQHLGRYLESNEIVHHIDGDKLNNDINNLFVCSDKEHGNINKSLQDSAFELVKVGIINFDKKRKMYYYDTNDKKIKTVC